MYTSVKLIFEILGWVILAISLMPLIRNDYWTFRVFEYPRFQKLLICLFVWIVLLVFLYYDESENTRQYVLTVLLALNAAYLFWQIYPFLSISRKQVLRAREVVPENSISLITANVYQYNTQAEKYINNIKKRDADIILLLETNEWWKQQTEPLKSTYPYTVDVPLENTYGMLLFSRLELLDYKVEYLVENDIPSIHAVVVLPGGKKVQLYCVHPTPPVPNENPRSTERDKELLLVAKMASENKLPVIVMGDLNDVAWSYTTALFSKISGLLDPRRGRGFYNTFHAHYPFLRFPLDHVFCSVDFKLLDIAKLKPCGSDHFPMYLKLQYERSAVLEQEQPVADQDEKELADEKISKAS